MLLHTFTNEMINRMPVDGDYVLASVAQKKTTTGKDFIEASISDREGRMRCVKWDATPDEADALVAGSVVHIVGMVTEYKDALQITASEMLPVPTEEADLTPLVPVAPRTGEDMFNELYTMAENFKDEELSNVVCTILDEQKEHLLTLPGGKAMHHTMISGLLYHTTCMAEDAVKLSEIYTWLNGDLLAAGAILHDIGKIKEFQVGPLGTVTDYTVEGGLETHLYLGAHYVNEVCERLKVKDETRMLLVHMLLSHHGQPDYGSPVKPAFAEAYMLHAIDEMDSRMDMFHSAEQDLEPGTRAETGAFALDKVRVYKPSFRK